MRVYNLKKAADIIDLAKYVQSRVYWGSTFCDVTNNFNNPDHTDYKYFWDYCESYITEGYNSVVICDEVVLFKRGK